MKLLKFYTKECPQCKAQSNILKEFNDVEVEDIDCEEFPDIVAKYQVRSIPALVLVEDNGEFLRKITGVTALETIREIIKVESRQ